MLKILILSIPLSVIGFFDDLYQIKAIVKFGIQIITAIFFINFLDIKLLILKKVSYFCSLYWNHYIYKRSYKLSKFYGWYRWFNLRYIFN